MCELLTVPSVVASLRVLVDDDVLVFAVELVVAEALDELDCMSCVLLTKSLTSSALILCVSVTLPLELVELLPDVESSPAIEMAIENSKYSNVWGARNKAGAKFLEKMVDKIQRGEPSVIFDTSLLIPLDKVTKDDIVVNLSQKDIKNTYLGTQLLQDFATILNEFDTEIGIPTLPYQKKERMVTDEAESKQEDATSRSKIWVDTLNGCFKTVNPLLGTNMVAVHNYDVSRETSEEVVVNE